MKINNNEKGFSNDHLVVSSYLHAKEKKSKYMHGLIQHSKWSEPVSSCYDRYWKLYNEYNQHVQQILIYPTHRVVVWAANRTITRIVATSNQGIRGDLVDLKYFWKKMIRRSKIKFNPSICPLNMTKLLVKRWEGYHILTVVIVPRPRLLLFVGPKAGT